MAAIAKVIIAGIELSHSKPEETCSQPALAAMLAISIGINTLKPQQAANEKPKAIEIKYVVTMLQIE